LKKLEEEELDGLAFMLNKAMNSRRQYLLEKAEEMGGDEEDEDEDDSEWD